MYYLKTFGGLRLLRGGADGAPVAGLENSKTLLILAWLACRPERSESREFLAQFLWPGDRQRGRRALRQALFFLTHRAAGLLERSGDRVRLKPGRLNVDLWEWDRAIQRHDYRAALAVREGRFAADMERKVGVEAEHWIEAQNARDLGAMAIVYPQEVGRLLKQGEPVAAVALAREWVQRNPMIDLAQQLLIRTLAATGDAIGATQAFEEYRARLKSESESVSPELLQIMDRLRAEAVGKRDAASARVSGKGQAAAGGAIAVEVRGQTPSNGTRREVFSIAVFDRERGGSTEAAPPLLEVRVVGATKNSPAHATVVTGSERVPIRVPLKLRRHRYTLQVQPNGELALLVDGRTYWQSREATPLRPPAPVYVAFGAQRAEDGTAFGAVRIYSSAATHPPPPRPQTRPKQHSQTRNG
ncbi:MAG TPA: BTAD domain-containing putative transcriptional regulator [Gemmatimonadales bacterium]|nr:BTAD domain-containing putative transcriptional regulator [Gemmatimonadales bacterium]